MGSITRLVLSTGLIMSIGHRKEIRKLTFRALALRRSESRNCGSWRWFMNRNMELRCWLVHGNVKNNRINYLNELERSLIPWGLRVPIWKINFCSRVLRLSMLPRCSGKAADCHMFLRMIVEIKVSRDRPRCVFVVFLYVTKVFWESVNGPKCNTTLHT